MLTDRQTQRIVRSWLEDGRTALPDRVLDAVLAELPATPQRRSSWPARRIADMHTYAKLGSVAAVIAIAVIGISLIPGVGPGGTAPTGSPTPTPTTQPSPSSSPALGVPPPGDIPAGRYAWQWPHGQVAFELDDGWRAVDAGGFHRHRDTPAEVGLTNWLPGTRTQLSRVYQDACGADETLVDIGPTTADLVEALESQVGTSATTSDLEIGGLPAARLDMTIEPGLDPTTCRLAPDGPIQIWNQAQSGYLALFPATDLSYGQATIWSVDVDGQRLIFTITHSRDTDPADVEEIEAIIDSMTFE